MPFGIGFKYHPNKSLTLSAEYGFRKSWTDYIDDVSTTYVDNAQLTYVAGELAAGLADRSGEVEPGYVNAAGIKRGDDSLDDWCLFQREHYAEAGLHLWLDAEEEVRQQVRGSWRSQRKLIGDKRS